MKWLVIAIIGAALVSVVVGWALNSMGLSDTIAKAVGLLVGLLVGVVLLVRSP